MQHQIFAFFAFIGFFFLNQPLHAMESFHSNQKGISASHQQSNSDPWKNVQLKIENLTQKIEHVPSDPHRLDALFIERGLFFLFCGEYEHALDDFNHLLLDVSDQNDSHSEKNLARALWGRTLSFAFLGRADEFNEDLDRFANLIGLNDPCRCDSMSNDAIHRPSVSQEKVSFCSLSSDRIKRNEIIFCDEYCENTVDNTIKFMKAMCYAIRDSGIRATLYLFIEKMGDKARSCCKAGGFWRNCVDPMVKVADKWKIFGIPNDPYWD